MEEGEDMKIKLNPLLMEPILEILFDQLHLEDLNNCVTVCKLWSKEAIRAHCKRVTIQLFSQSDLAELWAKREMISGPNIVINKLLTSNLNLEDPVFESVLSSVANKLSTLVLNDGKVTLPKLHKLLRLVPNLVRLEIGTVKMVYEEFTQYHKLFPIYDENNPPNRIIFDKLKSLEFLSFNEPGAITPVSSALRTFPNLKSLTVSNFSPQRYSNFDGIQMPSLEELVILNFQGVDFEINEKHFKMLLRVQFGSLKKLKLINLKKTIDASLFREFVERHKETLTKLEIRQIYNGSDPAMLMAGVMRLQRRTQLNQNGFINIFPLDLPKLKKLRIDRSHIVSVPRIFESLPNMDTLFLDFKIDSNWMAILPKNMKNLPQLKELSISWIEPIPLKILAKSFTAVKILNINDCSDDILHVIYENMPQLEFLICTECDDGKVTSEAFTGIPCSRFFIPTQNSDKNESDCSSSDGEDERNFRINSYIGQLEKLRHIVLCFSFSSKICAGNMFEYGLQEVPSLKTVTIVSLELKSDVIDHLEANGCQVFEYGCESGTLESSYYRVHFGDVLEALSDIKTYNYTDVDGRRFHDVNKLRWDQE